jgi:hypothetical protein
METYDENGNKTGDPLEIVNTDGSITTIFSPKK